MYFIALGVSIVIFIASIALIVKKLSEKYFPKDLDKFFQSIDKFSSRKILKVKLFYKDLYFVNDPELIHKVLNSEVCLEKPRMIYKFFGLNDGLLCCKFAQWRVDRKAFSCSFNQVMVRGFIPIFCQIADRMIAKMGSEDVCNGREIDIIHFTERCTISMILASSFDVFPEDMHEADKRVDEVATATKTTSILLSERFKKILWFFDSIFQFTSTYREQMKLRKFLYKTLFEITDEKLKKNDNRTEDSNFVQNIFFNRLKIRESEMSQNQILDTIGTIVGAGFETTGTASAHCILFLAMYPHIQQRVYEEILANFPSNDDSEITLDSLAKLEYLECVMKESLRLGPTVHTIAREAMDHFEISPGKTCKKGSMFVINIYGLHHRKDLWGEDADEFCPERFMPDNFRDKQQFFIPFSAGKRNCIGYKYAYSSFKIMMIKLLRNFSFTTTLKLNEIKFNRQIALKLYGKHLVTIEKRKV